MLPLPPADQWLVCAPIAYSGLPAWKSLLAADRGQGAGASRHRRRLSHGALPTLNAIELDKSPTFLEQVGQHFERQAESAAGVLRPQSRTARHLVGPIFRRRPVPADLAHHHALAVVEGARQRRAADHRQLGEIHPRQHAARYSDILALIKDMAAYQDADVRPILAEVIRAAETTETAAIRKEQVALVDKLKSKGPGYQRDLKTWGYIGQGAIGITCVVLATISLSAAGLPCVIGGAQRRPR